MSNAIIKAAQAVQTAMTVEQIASVFQRIVIGQDLSALSEVERVEYYKIVCERLGLDAYRKPFDLIVLNGKLQMYANKECAAQLASTRGISLEIVSKERNGEQFVVTARATTRDGIKGEDIGVVTLPQSGADAIANAMMKATTKAKRRAILSTCGLGMLDQTEVESIEDAVPVPAVEVVPELSDGDKEALATWETVIADAEDADALTSIAVNVKTLPVEVRNKLRTVLTNRATAMKLKWVKDKFVELA